MGVVRCPAASFPRRPAMSGLTIRRPWLLVALLAGACCIAAARGDAAASGAKDEEQPAVGLDGTWKLISIEQEGVERMLEDDVRLVIAKDQVLYGGELL